MMFDNQNLMNNDNYGSGWIMDLRMNIYNGYDTSSTEITETMCHNINEYLSVKDRELLITKIKDKIKSLPYDTQKYVESRRNYMKQNIGKLVGFVLLYIVLQCISWIVASKQERKMPIQAFIFLVFYGTGIYVTFFRNYKFGGISLFTLTICVFIINTIFGPKFWLYMAHLVILLLLSCFITLFGKINIERHNRVHRFDNVNDGHNSLFYYDFRKSIIIKLIALIGDIKQNNIGLQISGENVDDNGLSNYEYTLLYPVKDNTFMSSDQISDTKSNKWLYFRINKKDHYPALKDDTNFPICFTSFDFDGNNWSKAIINVNIEGNETK